MNIKSIVSTLSVTCLTLLLLVLMPMLAAPPTADQAKIEQITSEPKQTQQGDLPDLAVESFIIIPTNPHTFEPATIRVVARNVGPLSVPGRRLYLYIDPPQQPPTRETTPTHRLIVMAIPWPSGDAVSAEYAEFTFDSPGCGHVVYAWVDPLEAIEESDEMNNLHSIPVCVENEPIDPDAYEQDNVCNENNLQQIETNGIAQVRNFNPVGDVDWVRYYVTQGKEYTVTAAGTGEQASPSFEVANSCDLTGGFGGTTSSLTYIARSTGWHYMRLKNHPDQYDPILSTYELTVHESVSGIPPLLESVSPTSSLQNMTETITMLGSSFGFPPTAYLCRYENGQCSQADQCNQLLNTSWLSEQHLLGTVPSGLNIGRYCVRVTNPNGQSHTLANAFNIKAEHELNLPFLLMQPTPTATPVPEPTATLTPVITNGDFESRTLNGWQTGGQLPTSVEQGEPPNTTYAALLGSPKFGVGDRDALPAGPAYIEQQLTVPTSKNPKLTFSYHLISYDVLIGAITGQVWDTLDVTIHINGVKQKPFFRTGNPDGMPSNEIAYNSGWQQAEMDLTAHRGKTITLRFAVWNREYDSSPDGLDLFNTWAYVDKIQIVR